MSLLYRGPDSLKEKLTQGKLLVSLFIHRVSATQPQRSVSQFLPSLHTHWPSSTAHIMLTETLFVLLC